MHLLKFTVPFLALATLCLHAAPAGENVVASAKKLAEAALLLPPEDRQEVRHRALAIILLAEYGRLLPASLAPDQWETLENLFLEAGVDDSLRRQQAARLPPADTVSFDGGRLEGGGFARIDSIIGTNGRPIALDRRLPTRLIPLNSGEENRLHQAASSFSATPSAESIRERTDALYRARLGNHMVGDGIFYRSYAGRTDDLYYRLVQENPRNPTEMNFYAISESLPGRRYHPLTGIGSPDTVPSPWFSVSEILSGGGLLAVEDFKSRNRRADVRNPFFGFAARVLPFLGSSLEKTRPGEELNVSKDAIRRAIQNTQRFTPKPVEPIFNDPSRFFGCLLPRFILVAKRMSRAEMAAEIRKIDFGTPLPDLPGEPVGNEVLTDPSKWTKDEFFQELPGLLALDASAEYDPDKDLFAAAPTAAPSEPGPSPTAPKLPRPRTPAEVVASRRPRTEGRPSPSSTPAVPAPVLPLPLSNPLVAAMPSRNPPEKKEKPIILAAATPVPIVVLPETEFPGPASTPGEFPLPPAASTDLLASQPPPAIGASAFPGSARPEIPPLSRPLLADNIASQAPLRPSAQPSVTPKLLALEAVEFPGVVANSLELPPAFSDLLSFQPPAGAPAFPGSSRPELRPLSRPLLADNIASQAPLRPSAQPSATPKLLVLNDARPEELFSAPSLVGAPAALPLDFPPAQPSSSPLLALLAPSSSPSLPQIANLVAGPAELPAPREAVAAAVPAAQPAPQLPAAPAVPPEPSSGHYLAVLTPDISDSEKYLSDLTSSDAALAKNAATLNRVNSYLRWMNSALEPVESYLSSTAGLASAQKAELQAAATATTAELGVLLDQRQSLIEQREKLLADRGRLRTGIEGEPLRRSTAKLDTLLGRPIEVSKLFAFFSPFQKNL